MRFCPKRPAAALQEHVPAAGPSPARRLSTSMPPPPPPQCTKCNTTFKTVQATRTHERHCKGRLEKVAVAPARRLSTTLPVNNDNICPVCGDSLPSPTGLKVHILTHKKWYFCNFVIMWHVLWCDLIKISIISEMLIDSFGFIAKFFGLYVSPSILLSVLLLLVLYFFKRVKGSGDLNEFRTFR